MKRLLTISELSDLLQVSKRTIYDWTHTGFVPHYKLQKGLRFKEPEIERWLNQRKKKGRSRYKLDASNIC